MFRYYLHEPQFQKANFIWYAAAKKTKMIEMNNEYIIE
jgi:hypothetical protein